MALFADFLRRIKNQRVEAPRKIELPLEPASSDEIKEEKNAFATKNIVGSLILVFVEHFRNMIDFRVEKIREGDPDYIEFCNDPKIPLLNYVDKIVKYNQLEWTALPGSIVLLEKMKRKRSDAKISVNNMHRLITVALLIASKFLEDTPAANEDFARSSGFDLVCFDFL